MSSGSVNTTAIGCSCVITNKRIGVRRVHHVAHIYQPQSDTATDRRRDVRVNQIQFRIVDRCLVSANRPSNWSAAAFWVSTCCRDIAPESSSKLLKRS